VTYNLAVLIAPELTVLKSGSVFDGKLDSAIDVVNYTVIIASTGNNTLDHLTVTDAKLINAAAYKSGDSVVFKVGTFNDVTNVFTQTGIQT
jgi:hypothetical protein